MYTKDENKTRLVNILFVSNLRVNLLSSKHIYQKNLYKDFNKNNIWIQNKQDKRIFTTNQQKDVYIVNKIALNLNKFALIVIIQQEFLIIFLSINNAFNLK